MVPLIIFAYAPHQVMHSIGSRNERRCRYGSKLWWRIWR